MKKKEKKDYIFSRLDAVLKPEGYKSFKTGGDPTYVLNSDDRAVYFFMNFKDMGYVTFSSLYISIHIVENILHSFCPYDDSVIDKKKYFPDTIYDRNIKLIEGYRRGIGYEIEEKSQLEEFTDWVIDYLENDGKQFIETYSYLPNVLKRMDELTIEGKVWQNNEVGILSGALDAQLRGLIIAKLCNDNGLNDKILMCDEIFYRDQYKDWLPYYIKLKEQLPSIQPLYNV